jgi:hypothetical protein
LSAIEGGDLRALEVEHLAPDALELARIEVSREVTGSVFGQEMVETQPIEAVSGRQRLMILAMMSISLALTIVVMIPITWTYGATRHDAGFHKTFVRALIILPICATTIVLLSQDSLALAFGLAALVAAVTFRVALRDPIDGIYIFSAICVGLATSIGYLGIAMIMAVVFCFANALLWQLDYGRNPLDDARAAKERSKLEGCDEEAALGQGTTNPRTEVDQVAIGSSRNPGE